MFRHLIFAVSPTFSLVFQQVEKESKKKDKMTEFRRRHEAAQQKEQATHAVSEQRRV